MVEDKMEKSSKTNKAGVTNKDKNKKLHQETRRKTRKTRCRREWRRKRWKKKKRCRQRRKRHNEHRREKWRVNRKARKVGGHQKAMKPQDKDICLDHPYHHGARVKKSKTQRGLNCLPFTEWWEERAKGKKWKERIWSKNEPLNKPWLSSKKNIREASKIAVNEEDTWLLQASPFIRNRVKELGIKNRQASVKGTAHLNAEIAEDVAKNTPRMRGGV